MTLQVTATAYTGLGPGPHAIVCTGIERKTSAKFGGFYLRWEFTDEAGATATANSSTDLTPGNKTGKWFSALTGITVEVGANYDLSQAIGKPGSIFIEETADGYPKVISVTPRVVSPRRTTPTAVQVAKDEHAKQEGDVQDDLPF